MKMLLGTTNPSKVRRFTELLCGYRAEFLTLGDLSITAEPAETGATPLENAQLKAAFYGQFNERVICNDSGLYIAELQLNDARQPGLHVRSPQGVRLSDDEMLEYYSNLIGSLGGRALCYYLDGIAVYNNGTISGFMESAAAMNASAFYMVSTVHPERHPGWPLDSMSITRDTGAYFVEAQASAPGSTAEHIMLGEYRQRLTAFLADSLGLTHISKKES